ncbi:hypothetical protein L218DRAFT_541429 [Marasmius fiardii PR-910]|nr:hypothetical protein L218DRAFT_541429 [Marasmius fiardii PR-910]
MPLALLLVQLLEVIDSSSFRCNFTRNNGPHLQKGLNQGFVRRRAIWTSHQPILSIDWIGTLLFICAGIPVLLGLSGGFCEGRISPKVIVCFIIGVLPFIYWQHLLGKHQEFDKTFSHHRDKLSEVLRTERSH